WSVGRTAEAAKRDAIVCREGGRMHVAGIAPAGHSRGRAAAVVGDSVRARVRAVRLAAVARAEQHSHETGRVKVRCVRDEVLRDGVLVMAARVVLGQEVLVAYGNLPC